MLLVAFSLFSYWLIMVHFIKLVYGYWMKLLDSRRPKRRFMDVMKEDMPETGVTEEEINDQLWQTQKTNSQRVWTCARMHIWSFYLMYRKLSDKLTLFMYSLNKSCRACRTALHSATMRSRRSSRVHDESAIRAAPLIMLSKRSSREGRKRASLNVKGSKMILFCWVKRQKEGQDNNTA